MKNRKREICTSGSVRDEAGQPPHLLGGSGARRRGPCQGAHSRMPERGRLAFYSPPARPTRKRKRDYRHFVWALLIVVGSRIARSASTSVGRGPTSLSSITMRVILSASCPMSS